MQVKVECDWRIIAVAIFDFVMGAPFPYLLEGERERIFVYIIRLNNFQTDNLFNNFWAIRLSCINPFLGQSV